MKKIAKTLVDAKILDRALLAGVLCETGFMLLGHYCPLIDEHFGLFGVMMIAGTAALLYARDLARGYVAGALGGLVIGAACGVVAVGIANLLSIPSTRWSGSTPLWVPDSAGGRLIRRRSGRAGSAARGRRPRSAPAGGSRRSPEL